MKHINWCICNELSFKIRIHDFDYKRIETCLLLFIGADLIKEAKSFKRFRIYMDTQLKYIGQNKYLKSKLSQS